jgi:hypothetical protein
MAERVIHGMPSGASLTPVLCLGVLYSRSAWKRINRRDTGAITGSVSKFPPHPKIPFVAIFGLLVGMW